MSEQQNQLENISKGNVFASDESYKRAMEIAKVISSSDLVPATYHNKPANCLIALDVARQVRSSPLIVMQNLHIILGKPSWSSTYIAGAIRTKFRTVKVVMEGEGMGRSCQVFACDDKNQVIAEGVKVTMKMAKEEGWIDKKGSKWKTMPDLMLQYRANAFFGRVYCPDVLLGLQSEFEIYDVKARPVDVEVATPFKENAQPVKTNPEKPQPENPQIEQEKPQLQKPEKEEPSQSDPDQDLIIQIQAEIEKFLDANGRPTSLIFRYSLDIYKKTLANLTLAEMKEFKAKVLNNEI